MTAGEKRFGVFAAANQWTIFPCTWIYPRIVYDHLGAAIKLGESLKPDRFFTAAQREEIASAFRKVSDGKLADVRSGTRPQVRLWRTPHLPRAKRALRSMLFVNAFDFHVSERFKDFVERWKFLR